MTINPTVQPAARNLRLWPGVLLVAAQWFLWFVLPVVWPDAGFIGFLGGAIAVVLIVAWWLFFSRAPWMERIGAVLLFALGTIVTSKLVHVSIAGGMMGLMPFIYPLPGLCLGLVLWAVIANRMAPTARRVLLVVAVVLSCGVWTMFRTDGIQGSGAQLRWRWTPTAEERLLAQGERVPDVVPAPVETAAAPAAAPAAPVAAKPETAPAEAPKLDEPGTPPARAMTIDWAGFRGSDRDGAVHGIRIATDWTASPPVLLWRRPIGPGWSSFAVGGGLLFTQEQRGDDEIVAAYKADSGAPVWHHRDPVRFWESNGGAGPRATPTLHGGRVYALGATGVLNALDAATGALVWSRNAVKDSGATVPDWGISSSPLVVNDVVVVGPAGKLIAYDLVTGKPRWTGPTHKGSYSSPHLATLGGVQQILMLSGAGTTSVSPVDGKVLWEHAWPGATIVQPATLGDSDVIVTTSAATGGLGVRRLSVAHASSGWTATERWTSTGLKPYFNDYVVHKGHAFGFDGNILSCISLEDGARKWKGGRYGNGQLALLADEDLLLVLSEDGELALVSATADKYAELAKVPALEGKTWNHPVVVGQVLYVRNGEQMAAFRLPPRR